jgi:hypothetical protein
MYGSDQEKAESLLRDIVCELVGLTAIHKSRSCRKMHWRWNMTDKEDDPIVAEVRKARAQLNEEAHYDLKTLASKVAESARNAGFKVCP